MTRQKRSNLVLAGLSILTTMLAQVNATVMEAPLQYETWNPTFNQTTLDTEEDHNEWLKSIGYEHSRNTFADKIQTLAHEGCKKRDKACIAAEKRKAYQEAQAEANTHEEKLCFDHNTVDGICTVENTQLRFEESFYYRTKHSLVFNNVKLYCLGSESHDACDIAFNVDKENGKFEMNGDSSIAGRQIVIESFRGGIILNDNSHFNVTGMSRATNGTMADGPGANFIGMGGACNELFEQMEETTGKGGQPYGTYSMVPNAMKILHFDNQLGSMGNPAQKLTSGGGRIVLMSDYLELSSGMKLQADGMPLEGFEDSERSGGRPHIGGTGGYIFTATHNKYGDNKVDENAQASARGGYGTKGAAAGSGGVIVIAGENTIPIENAMAYGGLSSFEGRKDGNYNGCNNAGAGTVYQTTEDRLVVNNNDHMSTKLTRINVPHDGVSEETASISPENDSRRQRQYRLGKKHDQDTEEEVHSTPGSFFTPFKEPGFDTDLAPRGRPQIVAAALEINGQANVVLIESGSWLEFDDLTMDTDTTLLLGTRQDHMTLNFGKSVRLSTESTLDFSQAKVLVFNATVEDETAVGTIFIRHTLVINANKLVVGGQIGLPGHAPDKVKQGTTVALRASENIYFRGSSSLEAGHIWVHANNTIASGDGFNVTSTTPNTCNQEGSTHHGDDLFTCMPYKTMDTQLNASTFLDQVTDQFDVRWRSLHHAVSLVARNYTVYMVAFNSIDLSGASITGPRVGMCAPEIDLYMTDVDVAGKGCVADDGIGKGRGDNQCSGSGGAHGGLGGYGGVITNSGRVRDGCTSHAAHPYFHGHQAIYEGSGGASPFSGMGNGGAGGGIIWLSANGTISLEGTNLKADGSHAQKWDHMTHGGLSPEDQMAFNRAREEAEANMTRKERHEREEQEEEQGQPIEYADAYKYSLGAGGGAGGSIQIITKNLRGDAKLSLRGGNGYHGGGGGSGGRAVINYLASYIKESYPEQSYFWDGEINLEGGLGEEYTDKAVHEHSERHENSSRERHSSEEEREYEIINLKKDGETRKERKEREEREAAEAERAAERRRDDTDTRRRREEPEEETSHHHGKKKREEEEAAAAEEKRRAERLGPIETLQPTSGQQGTVYHSKCHGGYAGAFCQPCEVGTFKLGYSFGVCKPCENKPITAFYTERGVDSAVCPYECAAGLDPVEVNPYCENAIGAAITRVGGSTNSLVVVMGFLLLLVLIWISLISRSNKILESMGDANSKVYDGVLFNTDAEKDEGEAAIGKGNLGMQDSDIWSHSHRMYLIGENSINFPWYIPRDFPFHALEQSNRDKFIRFLKTRQVILDWTDLQKELYYAARIFFPPAADWLHKRFRQAHFTNLQDGLYETFDKEFFDERTNKTLRVAMSADDCHLAYIDFLDKSKSKLDYLGPKLPIALMLSGSGTFNSPYCLDFESDPYAKSLVYFNQEQLKVKLPLFFDNLNTQLSKLSFFKTNRQAMKDLGDVIDWVETGNKTLFNPVNIKAVLYIFENSYQEVQGGSFKQKRRSLPLESLIFEAFPDMYQCLIKFVQTKLLVRKSEIRFGLIFRPYSQQKNQRMRDRVRKVIQQQRAMNKNLGEMDVANTENLFVSDDEDEDDDGALNRRSGMTSNSNSFTTENKNTLDKIDKSNDLQEQLIDENQMQESEVFVHNSHSEFVKIVDKNRRAFSFSLDSTKSFEMSLKKPRNSCKDKCTRQRASCYACWLLTFKHHGKAPGKNGLYAIFFAYAFMVALDLMCMMSMFAHIFGPISNMKTIGITFLLCYPGIAVIAPILGTLGCLFGSPRLLRHYSSMNSSCVLVNYPLTLVMQWIVQDEPAYVGVLLILFLNKISLSFFGAKVRQHLINPGFIKNERKFQEMADLQVTTASRFPRSRILTATDASEVSEDPRSLLVKADGPKISSVMDGEIDAEVPELKPEENKEEQSVAVQQDEEEEFPQTDFQTALNTGQADTSEF